MDERVRVLVITGSMGSGKTTILGEASDLLASAGVAHAAADLDAFGTFYFPDPRADDLAMENLASVWVNYAKAGVRRLLVAEALERPADRERLRSAIPGADVIVCRLRAPLETMRQRVRQRETGMLQEAYVARVAELESLLDAARVEDFDVENDGRAVTDVARELLLRAGWIERQTGEREKGETLA